MLTVFSGTTAPFKCSSKPTGYETGICMNPFCEAIPTNIMTWYFGPSVALNRVLVSASMGRLSCTDEAFARL